MDRSDISLTPAEWHVMEVLWEHAPCTGREVVEQLTKSVGWSRSTVLTMLRRMHEKALIACSDTDGVLVYSPLARQEEATSRQTQDFLDRVYHGSIAMMLSAFTKKQPLSKEELSELYAILDEAKEGSDHD